MCQEIYGWIYGLQSPSGKWYIGQTTQEPNSYIMYNYKNKDGKNRPKIKRALNKYGFESFHIKIIDVKFSADTLNEAEAYYIKSYDSVNNGYNCLSGGKSSKHCIETRKKMSKAKTGKVGPWKGKKRSPETIEKMRIATKERLKTQDYKINCKFRSDGLDHPRTKPMKVKNIETGEILYGCLTKLGKIHGFYRDALIRWGHSKGWELIYE